MSPLFVGALAFLLLFQFPGVSMAATPRLGSLTSYQVNFTEAGLPAGTTWNVTFNGTTQSSVTSSMTFVVSPGIYAYSVSTDIPGQSVAIPGLPTLPPLEQYVATSATGIVEVTGSNATVAVNYTTQYLLFTTSTPTAGGTTGPGLGYFDAGTQALIVATPYQNYTFTAWAGFCYSLTSCGAYLGASSEANVTMSAPTFEIADFTLLTYPVNFVAHGLTANLAWSVTFNGTTSTSTTNTISFSQRNGTFPYSVQSPVPYGQGSRFVSPVTAGNVTVNGNATVIPVNFTEQFYLTMGPNASRMGTILTDSGWYDNGSTVTLMALPSPGFGFVGWVGQGVGSYSGSQNHYKLPMVGPVSESAVFAPLYRVSFREQGLPQNTSWSVGVGNGTNSSQGSSLTFLLSNGTYNFSVGPLAGYATGNHSGALRVAGGNLTIFVNFHPFVYNVTFSATGLPGGTLWWIHAAGATFSSNTSNLTLLEPNGTYSLSITAADGYTFNQTGFRLQVNGSDEAFVLSFLPPPAVDNGLFGVGVVPSYLVLEVILGGILVVAVAWWKAFTAVKDRSRKPKSVREDETADQKDSFVESSEETTGTDPPSSE